MTDLTQPSTQFASHPEAKSRNCYAEKWIGTDTKCQTTLQGLDRTRKGGVMLTAAPDHAVEAIELTTGSPVVSISIEGSKMLAAFELDPSEHKRRQGIGVGAITSKALLHGLWSLPSGGFVPSNALPDVKVQRLRMAPHSAIETGCGFWRVYAPPGTLRSVAFDGPSVDRSVHRAIKFTPIVQRFVLTHESNGTVPWPIECLAREWGVGIIDVEEKAGPRVIVPASPAEVGVPSVYRWWMAELAYKHYLYERAQLVS